MMLFRLPSWLKIAGIAIAALLTGGVYLLWRSKQREVGRREVREANRRKFDEAQEKQNDDAQDIDRMPDSALDDELRSDRQGDGS